MYVSVDEYYELLNEDAIIEVLDEMYYTEELMEQIEAKYDALTRSSRVKPSGRIMYMNTITGQYEPVKNVEVKVSSIITFLCARYFYRNRTTK